MATKLTQDQLEDAARLKKIFESRKAEDRSLTQESLAALCGWKTQSAVTQYLNGVVPLNLDALIKFSLALNASITEISPTLSQRILAVRVSNEDSGISKDAMQVARAYDRLERPAQKAAVTAQLEAFGVLK
jgi:transcriptional regulator with XRE-family HTH domain